MALFILFSGISASAQSDKKIARERKKLQQILDTLSTQNKETYRSLVLAKQAKELAVNLKDIRSLCLSFKHLGNAYFAYSSFDSALYSYSNALVLAKELKDTLILSDCYYNISMVYKSKGNYSEALKISKLAFELDYIRNDSVAMAESYNSIGIIYENFGDYEKAHSFYLKSLQILEKRNDKEGIARRYNNLGIIFNNLSNVEIAKKYLLRSISIFDSVGNFAEKCNPLISLGDLYEKTGKYDSAFALYYQALSICRLNNDTYLEANTLSRIGEVFYLKGDFEKAIQHYQQLYLLAMRIHDMDGIIRVKINLSKSYFQQQDYFKAEQNLNEAFNLWQAVKSKPILADIWELYYNIYKKKNNTLKALKYLEFYTQIKDSIFNESANRKIYEMQTIYETEKKEKENEILKQANQIQLLKLNRSRITRNSFISVAILIFIISIFIFSRYRTKIRVNRILEEKNKQLEAQKNQILIQKTEIERKNIQITDSIEYAGLMQQSLLPNMQVLHDNFPDSFIIFMPRDIVSGDFYWFLEKENHFILAIADCTGHGVPAAFMSMLGSEILSEIFEQHGILHTDSALSYLGTRICKTLHQEKTGNEDGMEIVICIIDKVHQKIEFSSARRPILYFKDNTFHEVKGDKTPVGGKASASVQYTRHIIEYHESVSIYLFSDGFHDQFGGPHNGKITYNLFKELIQLHADENMNKQKENLLEFIESWKSGTAQIDDILVTGIRIG